MQVAFRVDGSAQMGGGHVMRCLALANALRAAGAETVFLCASLPDSLELRFASEGHKLLKLPVWKADEDPAQPWDSAILSANLQVDDADRALEALEEWRPRWMVVDHYRLDANWEKRVRAGVDKILVIDDLANRYHDCDLIVDQTFGRCQEHYRPWVPPRSAILTGAAYALLRPEFGALRGAALRRRSEGGIVQRILISMGSTDVRGITLKVVQWLVELGSQCNVDIVLNSAAGSLPAIKKMAKVHPHLHLHIDQINIAELMARADLAIGAAGTTSWERCCLALPSLVVVLAANQEFIAQELDAAGAHKMISKLSGAEFKNALNHLVEDEAERMRMARAAAQVTDGYGIERILTAMEVSEEQF